MKAKITILGLSYWLFDEPAHLIYRYESAVNECIGDLALVKIIIDERSVYRDLIHMGCRRLRRASVAH